MVNMDEGRDRFGRWVIGLTIGALAVMCGFGVVTMLGGFDGRPAPGPMQESYQQTVRPALVIIGEVFETSGIPPYQETDLPAAEELRSGSWADPAIFGGAPTKTFWYQYVVNATEEVCREAAVDASEALKQAGFAGLGGVSSHRFDNAPGWIVTAGWEDVQDRCEVRLFGFNSTN